MSLTSYRAAPPRAKTRESRKRGTALATIHVAIATLLGKAAAMGGRRGAMGKSSTTHGLISWYAARAQRTVAGFGSTVGAA